MEASADRPITSFRQVLPPSEAAPQLPPLPVSIRRAFGGGHEAVYRGSGQEGPSTVTSSALSFSDSTAAGGFLEYLRQAQTADVALGSERIDTEEFDAPAVGDDGYAWHRLAPNAETAGCSWRRGELVLSITVSGDVGEATSDTALDLARTLDGRLG